MEKAPLPISAYKMDLLIDTCLMAGRIMIESGSEMYRVEDTITRIAFNAGVPNSVVYTTPTGLFFGVKGQPVSEFRQINQRTINLEKVQRVNTMSRKFAEHEVGLWQLHTALEEIDRHTDFFPLWLQVLGSMVVSAMFMVLFSGQYDWVDFAVCGVIGGGGYLINYYISLWTKVKFLGEFLAALTIGILAYGAVHFGIGRNINNILIGAMMPLVPGVPLTNSLRDLFAGHLLTGTVRAVEAFLTACAIGTGIGLMFRFFM